MRLQADLGAVTVSRASSFQSIRALTAVTSSRLGRDPAIAAHVCRYLGRSLLEARSRGSAVLIASGSAIEPWAVRAAELFAVRLVRVSVEPGDGSAEIAVARADASPLSRDAVAIALAERVDAVYVRRGGTIAECLHRRLENRPDATTRVAVSRLARCAAPNLIAAGAIGWYLARSGSTEAAARALDGRLGYRLADEHWTLARGRWLIHCTRGRAGPWPDETERQYRDSMLLGDPAAPRRGPLEALARIVRGGRIIASAVATRSQDPVVCFSALPLRELLCRRCFRPHLGRWDYEPYGIAIRLSAARRLGVKPVLYGEPNDRASLSPQDRFRFHPHGKTFNWRQEQEWRSCQSIDLTRIDPDDIRVFAPLSDQSSRLLCDCPWPVTFLGDTFAQAV